MGIDLYDIPDLRPFRTIQHGTRLAGGAIVTENGTLASDDYVPGISGWIIYGDGTCEFNSGTFRGEIDAAGLNISINATDDGAIEFYDIDGILVGRLTADVWELGDLATPGLRTTLDPVGGLRFRGATDLLLAILDQNGMSLTDEASGLVAAQLTQTGLALLDPVSGEQISFQAASLGNLVKPKYVGNLEVSPSSSLVSPAATLFGANDLELAHVAAAWAGVQTATWTPPAGWTEVIDNDYGVASTLATSVGSRQPATGTAGTFTSNRTNWNAGVGTRIVVKGTVGGTAPAVRSSAQSELTTTSNAVTISCTKPTGTAAGDTLILFVALWNRAGGVPTGWVTPTGWQFLGAYPCPVGTTGTLAVGAWAKSCTSGEPSSYSTKINFSSGTKTVHVSLLAISNPTVPPGGVAINVRDENIVGDWLPWTPTCTNVTPANTLCAYKRVGRSCHVRIRLSIGATTGMSGSGVELTLPFNSGGATALAGNFYDASALGRWSGSLLVGTSGNIGYGCAHQGIITAISPFTWAVNDFMLFGGVYETT